MAKLDTIVHELYHIDPHQPGIRRIERADGTLSAKCHSPAFFQDVVEMVTQYLTSSPDPEILEFLHYDFAGLTARYGGVVATTFRTSSYPRRYVEVVAPPARRSQSTTVRVERARTAPRASRTSPRTIW